MKSGKKSEEDIVTLKLRIRPDDAQKSLIAEIVSAYTASYNRLCELAWDKRIKSGAELHKQTYYPEKAHSGLTSGLVVSARMRSMESLKSVRERIKRGKRASCPKSKSVGVRYYANTYTINLNEGIATFAEFRSNKNKRFKLSFKIPRHLQQYRDWKPCTAEICIDKHGRHWLHMAVSKPTVLRERTKEVTGIDLGVCRPAVTSKNQFFGKRSWRNIESRYFRLIRALQSKGTKSAIRHLRELSGRRKRFRRDCDHVLSKRIVHSANEGSTIVLENLTGIRDRVKARKKQRRRIHSWSFNQLQSFIEYKAKLYNRYVEFINPAYTSQMCSKCKYTAKSNRKSQGLFCCKKCKCTLNADLNASRNIKNKYLEAPLHAVNSGCPVNQPIVST